MNGESNTATRLRIAAYAEADQLLAEHRVTIPGLTHDELRGLLVLSYLEGYSQAGEWVQARIDETVQRLAP